MFTHGHSAGAGEKTANKCDLSSFKIKQLHGSDRCEEKTNIYFAGTTFQSPFSKIHFAKHDCFIQRNSDSREQLLKIK